VVSFFGVDISSGKSFMKMNIGNKAVSVAGYLGMVFFVPLGLARCKNQSENKQTAMASNGQSMKGFTTNIEKRTRENKDFRNVLYTSQHMQLVLMSLRPNEEIGEETHAGHDQFFRVEAGHGICKVNNATYNISDGDVVIVPAGAKHNVINTDSVMNLQLYTIYSPPEHKDHIIRATKADAQANEEEFDGKTSE
jgi:mannose-6-phosphate isomerase-like protein (cupin superfamily)